MRSLERKKRRAFYRLQDLKTDKRTRERREEFARLLAEAKAALAKRQQQQQSEGQPIA
ncbi:hypothetical protein Q2941_04755 [Bradyrhizobium sp. UFLA05-153]